MDRLEALEVGRSGSRVTRRKLLKRAAVGGGLLVAAPILTSPAHAVRGGLSCGTIVTEAGVQIKCNPELGGCAGQAPCKGEVPVGSFCTCVPKCGGEGEIQEGCFCHEVQPCAGLTPCQRTGDCPPGWHCTESCCPGGCFCLPPCGTQVVFATATDLVAANAPTTVG